MDVTQSAKIPEVPDWRESFAQARAALPDQIVIPYAYTAEGQRLDRFKRSCPEQFFQKVKRELLPNPTAFDAVANWNGSFPGPCAHGAADTAKTRATWSALGRLYVRENKGFAWFPVKRLLTEMREDDDNGDLQRFFRRYREYSVLMVDDVEKLNWDFGSNAELLFAYYDWIYRERRPCITTSNKDAAWWEEKMGAGIARRMFKDGHFSVEF